VKDAVARDEQTGVGQIIATTPMSRFAYTFGKALSNFAILTVLVASMAITAGGLQFLRGEDWHLNLWALLSPFLFVTLPTMAVISSLAVLFETSVRLRSTAGNVVYFLLWMGTLLFTFAASSQLQRSGNHASPTTDLFGVFVLLESMAAKAHTIFPGYTGGFTIGATTVEGPLRMFV
jgi:ABC-type Na+ efflux pump permease subunit